MVDTTNAAKAFYHLDLGCISSVNPSINLSEFAINDSDRSKLSVAHKEKLKKLGMVVN